MALREYKDRSGVEWKVWDVPPRFSPKRSGDDRRKTLERREAGDRRKTTPPPEWVHGWICFQAPAEKRRLCPLPEDWEHAPIEQLERYRKLAVPVRMSQP